MVYKSFIVENTYGIHARPARMIVETAIKFRCDITIAKSSEEINAKSIMGILMLEARKGTELVVSCQGEDENEALLELTQVFEKLAALKEWEEA